MEYNDLTFEDKQNALDEAWEIMNPKITNLERLNNIKIEITKARQLWKDEAYQEGDQILFDLEENDLNWLIERTERAQELEEGMKGAAVISNVAGSEIKRLEKLLEGNDGMSVKEIRAQFVDLYKDSLVLKKENERLREAHQGVINSSRDGSFPHVISTLALEDEN